MIPRPVEQKLPIEMNVLIQVKHDKPAIEFRRLVMDPDLMRIIIGCAIRGIPLTILPVFKDRIRSLGSLLDKGIIYYNNEKREYYFNI